MDQFRKLAAAFDPVAARLRWAIHKRREGVLRAELHRLNLDPTTTPEALERAVQALLECGWPTPKGRE